jgi:alpha-ketoglutarate-dependent taurine dioxygenase
MKALLAAAVALLVALPAFPGVFGSYAVTLFTLIFFYGFLGQAWNVVGGYAGQLSAGHAAFLGIGAYTAALLSVERGVTPWVGMFAGGALAAALGALIGFLGFRFGLRGFYFVLLTVAFSEICRVVAGNTENVVVGGRELGSLGNSEAFWHSDLNFVEQPPDASCLYALEVPPAGGDTGFANMYAAFETLPADLAAAIDGRQILHDARFNSAGYLREIRVPDTLHPIVRTHPETGRKALYLGRRANARIDGLTADRSDALLDRLWRHATAPACTWHHRWQAGDLVIWDNRCTLHRRDAFDPSQRRIMHRTQTRGTRPV